MEKFKILNADELNENVFKLIGSDWMLISAKKGERTNTMTASWGGFGVMWGKNVAFIVIRPQRYTKEFVDSANNFSLCFFDAKFKKQLSYLGSVSGKNEDKIAKSALKLDFQDNTPVFEEAKISIICRKLYKQNFEPQCFIEKDIRDKWYENNDFHCLYIGEIEKVLIKSS